MVRVLDIPFFDKDLDTAVNEALNVFVDINKNTNRSIADDNIASCKPNHCISATGAHGIIEAHKDPAFKQTLQNFWLNLPDGMPTVWVGRLKGAQNMQRCYGPDFFKAMMIATANLPINHFFCGGIQGVAEELKTAVGQKFNNQRVVGVFSPPFRPMTDPEMTILGQQIAQTEAHIVWIGISTPKQEKFAERLAKFVKVHEIITVGAAFDFHTNRVAQAPKWMQNAGLEWFFRLTKEPKRLYKRYGEIVPLFIGLHIKEFVDFYILKKR